MFQKNRSFFTHPNLQTHPNLPKGKEQITPHIDIQPPPSLPRRGGTDTLVAYYQKVIDNQSNLHLPFGGEREGADVSRKISSRIIC